MVLRGLARRRHVFPDLATASDALAGRLIASARAAVADRGSFRLAISGGKTPLPLYAALGGRYRARVPWAATQLFFVDERCVSPRSKDSNYRSVRSRLLSRVPIPRSAVHRMLGEVRPITEAARRYGKTLGSLPEATRRAPPLFDLVLLGLGPDGHIASLFPGQPAVRERRVPVVAVRRAGQPPFVPRLTLTVPAISATREAFFLVSGEDKADAVRRSLLAPASGDPFYPASLVRPAAPSEWFMDRAAAGLL